MSTSTRETFGCVFAEALHLGVPVIVDDTNSGTNEVVPPEQLCNFNNTEEVIKKIEEYRENRPKVFLNEKFYEKAIINEWSKLIESL
jgi:glycosyltransferase involved in cell wall biosynthesis